MIEYKELTGSKKDEYFCEWGSGLYLSTRLAGDCGPSGLAGRLRHDWVAQELGLGVPVLTCRQVHSMRVVLIHKNHTLSIWNGKWDLDNTTLQVYLETETRWLESELYEQVSSLEADGILTESGHTLGVTVADCMPLAIRARGWCGLLHSGWEGTGILEVALQALYSADTTLAKTEVEVVLGPAIGARDYPVPVERAELYKSRFGSKASVSAPDGQPSLDLRAANLEILTRRGSKVRAIVCTNSTVQTPWLQSYRRDAHKYGRSLCIMKAELVQEDLQ